MEKITVSYPLSTNHIKGITHMNISSIREIIGYSAMAFMLLMVLSTPFFGADLMNPPLYVMDEPASAEMLAEATQE